MSEKEEVEEVRSLNQKFKLGAGQVYAKRKMSARGLRSLTTTRIKEMFNNTEEASGFWRELWEGEGTKNSDAQWLEEIRSAIYSRVPPPSEEA